MFIEKLFSKEEGVVRRGHSERKQSHLQRLLLGKSRWSKSTVGSEKQIGKPDQRSASLNRQPYLLRTRIAKDSTQRLLGS